MLFPHAAPVVATLPPDAAFSHFAREEQPFMPAKKTAVPKSKKEPSTKAANAQQNAAPAESRAGGAKRGNINYRATTILARKKLISAAQYKLSDEDTGEDMSDLVNRLLFHYVTGNIKELRSSPANYADLGF